MTFVTREQLANRLRGNRGLVVLPAIMLLMVGLCVYLAATTTDAMIRSSLFLTAGIFLTGLLTMIAKLLAQ